MKDEDKTKEQLIGELVELRQRIAELETLETERQRAEEALHESEARYYRAIIEDQTELICRFLPDGTLTFVNEAYCRYFGKKREELIGHSFMPFILEEDQEMVHQQFSSLSPENPVVTYEHRVIMPNGEIRWQQWIDRAIFDEQDRFIEFQSVGRDITERQRAEEALRQRNRELALLNQASQVFNSSLDLAQVLATVLGEVRHLLEVVGVSVWLIDPETDEPVCRQASGPHSEIVRGWRLPPGEGIAGWVARHGESLIVPDTRADERHFKGVDQQTGVELRSILSVPLRVRQGVIGALHIVDTEVGRFDATDLTLLESLAATAAIAIENARLYERAWQDAETKATLLQEVNHRVKNNLSVIIGLLYVERRHVGMEDQTAYQSIMKDLTNRVQGLATVHGLLSDSEWAPLLLSELTAQVIRSSLQTLPGSKRISVDVTPSPVRVTSDQAHNLALVINELATNTVKYALQERDTAHIAVRIALDDDTVRFEFRDDGPGYSEEVLQLERHNVGFDLIQNIVHRSLRGQLSLHSDHGAVAIVRFKAKA